MRGRLQVIKPDGTLSLVRDYLDEAPGLDDLQKAVGGFIEIVPHWSKWTAGEDQIPCLAFCNEEGKLAHMRLPVNPVATALWHEQLGGFTIEDVLVGTVAIVTGDASFLAEL